MMGAGGARGLGLRGFAHGGREKEPDSLKISDRRMLLWFYSSLIPHWPKVTLALFAMLASTAAGLAIPLVLRSIFDDVIKAGNRGPLLKLSLLFLGLTVATQALGAARTNIMHLLGLRFSYDLRMRCFRHMIRLDLGYFQRQRSGDIMSRISNDVGAAENMVVHGSDDIISNSLFIIGAVGILFWMDWRMALVALAPIPIYVACLWVFAHYIRPIFRRIREELGEINAKLQERLAGIQVIKAFGREEAEEEYFDESAREFWRMSAKSVWMWSTFFPAMSVITSCGLVVLVWYGAGKAAVAGSGVTAGTVVAFMGYMQQFYRPIGMLARVQNTVNQCLASMARVFQLLDEEPDVKEKEDAVALGRVEGRVEIENVSFRYETGEMVLQDVSIAAEPGETVAIVGRSGAGKTSLINLIARFYDPIEGRILVDGYDLRDVTLHSLRRNIAMVLQETFLFNTTVKENILYGRPDAPEEDVLRAARAAHAHGFITGLENGYDTMIGERGVRLSGGEKQRIAIARAFLADPRILILDEATSMVDTEAEQIIQQALRDLMQGRTTFVIAHRLSTIRNANKIVVIDDGQVVEQDRHRALMEKGGLYADMVNRQVGMDLEETEWDGSILT
jgi:ABC-type multidrug transport system fused ATPase/permease subunit